MLSRKERWFVLSGGSSLCSQAATAAKEAAKLREAGIRAEFTAATDTPQSSSSNAVTVHAQDLQDANLAESSAGTQNCGETHPRKICTYEEYLRNRGDSEDVLEEDEQIDRDLERVKQEFIQHLWAQHGEYDQEVILESARKILRAFGTRNPDLGYVQGFHHMTMVLLSEFYDDSSPEATAYEEQRAFWVLCALCETIMGCQFYAKGPRKLKGFMDAVESVTETVSPRKFAGVKSVDKDGVIQLLALKWLLQVWADDDVVADPVVLKRIWDCMFLSSAGCGSMNPPESALRSVFRGSRPPHPRATDFHLRLAVAMIEDTPILSIPNEFVEEAEEVEESVGDHQTGLLRCASEVGLHRNRHTSFSSIASPMSASPPRDSESAGNSSETHSLVRIRQNRKLQSMHEMPSLRRKASIEDMGAHATGFVYNSILKRIRRLSPRKIEDLIMLAEQITLVRPKPAESKEENEKPHRNASLSSQDSLTQEDAASKAVLEFIEKLSASRSRSIPIRYSTFKRLAQSACPSWNTSDIMTVFSTLDVSRNGQIPSHFLIQQLPYRFSDRPVQEIEQLATAVYTYTTAAQEKLNDAGNLGNTNSSLNSIFGMVYPNEESCSAGTGSSCNLQ